MSDQVIVFAGTFATLYAAHQVADHWVQTSAQVMTKGAPGWSGRLACGRHVATYTAVGLLLLGLASWAVGLPLSAVPLAAGLAVSAVTHYVADRRQPLQRLAYATGNRGLWDLGDPATMLGSGAYGLDQSWHVFWLFVASLIVAQ
jgi:hypothetical protein